MGWERVPKKKGTVFTGEGTLNAFTGCHPKTEGIILLRGNPRSQRFLISGSRLIRQAHSYTNASNSGSAMLFPLEVSESSSRMVRCGFKTISVIEAPEVDKSYRNSVSNKIQS